VLVSKESLRTNATVTELFEQLPPVDRQHLARILRKLIEKLAESPKIRRPKRDAKRTYSLKNPHFVQGSSDRDQDIAVPRLRRNRLSSSVGIQQQFSGANRENHRSIEIRSDSTQTSNDFRNLETGQSATVDAPQAMLLVAQAAAAGDTTGATGGRRGLRCGKTTPCGCWNCCPGWTVR